MCACLFVGLFVWLVVRLFVVVGHDSFALMCASCACQCVCVGVSVSVCVCVSQCVYACLSVYASAWPCTSVCEGLLVAVSVCMFVNVSVCSSVCVLRHRHRLLKRHLCAHCQAGIAPSDSQLKRQSFCSISHGKHFHQFCTVCP